RVQSEPFRGAARRYSSDRPIWRFFNWDATRQPRAHLGSAAHSGLVAVLGGGRPKAARQPEATPSVKAEWLASLSPPLVSVYRRLRGFSPVSLLPPPPLASGRGRGASDMSPAGKAGKTAWGSSALPSALYSHRSSAAATASWRRSAASSRSSCVTWNR